MTWPSRLVPDAERRHRDPVLVRDREHLRHLGRRGRVDDEVGALRRVEAEVGAVEVALGVAVPDRDRRRAPRAAPRATSASVALTRPPPRTGRSSAVRPNAQRMLSCTTCSARSPSCASHAARKLLVAADRLAEPLARSRGRAGCSDRPARTAARPRRRAAGGRSPGSRSRGTPSAGAGTPARPARRRAAAGRAASPSCARSPPRPTARAPSLAARPSRPSRAA